MMNSPMINKIDISLIQSELSTGETLLWTGRPRQGIVLRPSDLYLIPFSLLWGGFALFWETSVIAGGAPFFFVLWGVPFLVVGAYITVGRFFIDAYQRNSTYYAVTDERAIIISGLFSRTVKSLNLRTATDITMEQRGNGSGSISFGPTHPYSIWYRGMAWPGSQQQLPPQFEMITDVKAVYALIRQAQQIQ